MRKYDYLVIGSGPAGHVSAIRAAQLGLKVAVVEKDPAMFGGVCLNEGCIPAKALFHGAELLESSRAWLEKCGKKADEVPPDMKVLVKDSRSAAEQLKKGLSFLFKKNGIELVHGKARFSGKDSVSISSGNGSETVVKADNYLIATGSAPKAIPGVPFDGKRVITSSDAIRLEKVPESMLIVGGGYIGAELASFFNILGSRVSIVEMEADILPAEDEEVSRRMRSIFTKKGIEVLTSSTVKSVDATGGKAAVTVSKNGESSSLDVGLVLVAIGRAPVTGHVGLDEAGVRSDDEGRIAVDDKMRTSAPNIYAAGDVVPGPMLAHAGYAEGEIAAEAAAGKHTEPLDHGCVPTAVYTAVEAASVGMTEKEAASAGIDYSTGKQFYKANGKAVVNSRTEGFVKVIAEKKTRKLLGAHIIGQGAADMIHEFVVAKRAGVTIDALEKTVHAHPTLSEIAVDACRAVFGKPVHG